VKRKRVKINKQKGWKWKIQGNWNVEKNKCNLTKHQGKIIKYLEMEISFLEGGRSYRLVSYRMQVIIPLPAKAEGISADVK
jgi:hypothetical protein